MPYGNDHPHLDADNGAHFHINAAPNGDIDPDCGAVAHDRNDDIDPHPDGTADGHTHPGFGPAFRNPDGLFDPDART